MAQNSLKRKTHLRPPKDFIGLAFQGKDTVFKFIIEYT
jgi:hypothetical protein